MIQLGGFPDKRFAIQFDMYVSVLPTQQFFEVDQQPLGLDVAAHDVQHVLAHLVDLHSDLRAVLQLLQVLLQALDAADED